MFNIIKFLIFALLFQTVAYSQTDLPISESDTIQKDSLPKERIWQKFKVDARNAANGFLYTFAQPTRWQKDDFVYLGATIIGTGVLYLNDEEISSFFRKQEKDMPHMVSESGYWFGKPQVNYGITGGVYVV